MELGHERWIPNNTSVTSREKPRSQGVHACGANDAFRRSTSKKPLEELRPVTHACMAREQQGHSQEGWPQRLGAQVGTQVVIPWEVAL